MKYLLAVLLATSAFTAIPAAPEAKAGLVIVLGDNDRRDRCDRRRDRWDCDYDYGCYGHNHRPWWREGHGHGHHHNH